MAITLIVNNTPFDYPEQGEQQPWGEAASGWATEVTTVINSLKGPSDILETSAPILINQTKAILPNFFFDPNTVGSFSAIGFVSIADEVKEKFIIEGMYNGSSWDYSVETIGDSGIKIEVENNGQVVYTSGAFSTIKSSYIKFKGTALIKK